MMATLLYLPLFVVLALSTFFYSGCKTSNKKVQVVSIEQKPWLRPGILNSTRIEEKFGSYGVQILLQDERSGIRLSNLYSENSRGEKIMRTLALVDFRNEMPESLRSAHQKILDGASIGQTLKDYGYIITKEIRFKGNSANMPSNLNSMMQSNFQNFATLIYDLKAKMGNIEYTYCTIAEVYAPKYLSVEELDYLYSSHVRTDTNADGVVESMSDDTQKHSANNALNRIRMTLMNL